MKKKEVLITRQRAANSMAFARECKKQDAADDANRSRHNNEKVLRLICWCWKEALGNILVKQ
jgi:hypothetical protein